MGTQAKQGTEGPTHEPGTRKGEELIDDDGKEAGRHEIGETGADRPAGGTTARDSTSINPDDAEPITREDGPSAPPA